MCVKALRERAAVCAIMTLAESVSAPGGSLVGLSWYGIDTPTVLTAHAANPFL